MKLTHLSRTALVAVSLLTALVLLVPDVEAEKKKKKKKDKNKNKAAVAAPAPEEETSSGLAQPGPAAREADRHLNAYDTAAAREALESASEASTDAWLATARGRVLEQKKDYDGAIAELRRAADLDTRNPAPVLFMGDTYAYASKRGSANDAYAQAESRARGLLDSNSEDPEALYYLGIAQQRQERFADAAQTLEKAKELRPGDSAILYQLGATRFFQERFQEAFDLLSAAIEKNSGIAYAYYYRGLAASQLQRKDVLYNDLDRFVKMAPEAPEADTAKQILASYG